MEDHTLDILNDLRKGQQELLEGQKQILQAQKEIGRRMEIIEESANRKYLSHGQATLGDSQQNIAKKVEQNKYY